MDTSTLAEITVNEFIECYKPICNECTPYPDNQLKEVLGPIIWDKRDYSRIAVELRSKTMWTIFEDDSSYYIVATTTHSMSNELVGYIICENPYETNDISRIKVVINKEELKLFD